MINNILSSKLLPALIIGCIIIFFIISFIRGNLMVQKSEKELNTKHQLSEAQASKYSLKEIDIASGDLRWELTAKEGQTENNLQGAIIKDISANLYKNNEKIFELTAPFAKASTSKKEIYLYGEVTARNKEGNFLLKSNELILGMGTSIEAQKGFNLTLKNNGTVRGENALINDDQTKIIIRKLKEASLKDIILSGEEVTIEKSKNGDITDATISKGGKVILKNQKNDSLNANTIKWKKDGNIEAIGNVTYTSEGKVFKADYLQLKPDKKVIAKNNVHIVHGETQCSGSFLSYENNSLIVLSGKPKAVQGNKQISAEKIIYDLNTGKVEALGNVRTIFVQKS